MSAGSTEHEVQRGGLNVSATFPFETVLAAAFNYATKVRETMRKEIIDEWDRLLLEDYKRARDFFLKVTGQ